jgi:hypothetical protein
MILTQPSQQYLDQAIINDRNNPGYTAGQLAQSVQRSEFPDRVCFISSRYVFSPLTLIFSVRPSPVDRPEPHQPGQGLGRWRWDQPRNWKLQRRCCVRLSYSLHWRAKVHIWRVSPSNIPVNDQSLTFRQHRHLWKAKWWTQYETPSTGGTGVWQDGGAC